jgi:hypothetical protein
MNYIGWKINRFMVRILWKPLQIWGFQIQQVLLKLYGAHKIELRIKMD